MFLSYYYMCFVKISEEEEKKQANKRKTERNDFVK